MTDVETRPGSSSIAGRWQQRACLVLVLSTSISPAMALSYDCASPNVLQSFTNDAPAGTATGSIQSFAVPWGVSSITIDAAGAQGGNSQQSGGLGAEVTATLPVSSGQTLCVLVGVQGNTSNGGSGGGGSFVFGTTTGTCASNLASVSSGSTPPNLLIVAAGGGGGGLSAGVAGNAPSGAGTAGASAGTAGDQSGGAGGTGGNGGGAVFNSGGGGGLLTDGTSANTVTGGFALVNGAAGGSYGGCSANGGFGGGGASCGPGGGGGGYNGGGAGGFVGGGGLLVNGGGGGGGSFSATTPIAANTASGAQTGNGAVNFCYAATTPVRLQSFEVK